MIAHISFTEDSGTLMRILSALSRRSIDVTTLDLETRATHKEITLSFSCTEPQKAQLSRDWNGIVGVIKLWIL